MIRLTDCGARGEDLEVSLNVHDLLSLLENLQAAAMYYDDRAAAYREEIKERPDPNLKGAQAELLGMVEGRAKDARANLRELTAVLDERERVLTSD